MHSLRGTFLHKLDPPIMHALRTQGELIEGKVYLIIEFLLENFSLPAKKNIYEILGPTQRGVQTMIFDA